MKRQSRIHIFAVATLLCTIIALQTLSVFAANPKDAVSYQTKTVNGISANIITVDMNNPEAKLKVVTVENKLNKTASFSDIISTYKPYAAVNGNFFNAYDKIKDPVGSLMSNGEFLYCSSGLTSMGITNENKIIFGKPSVFTKIYTTDNDANKKEQIQTAFEVNVLQQGGEQSVLYTPARGTSVPITHQGMVMEVMDKKITKYYEVSKGSSASIPSNGYILFFSTQVTSTDYFRAPEIGRSVDIRYEPFKVDEEKFDLANVKQVVSGSPRLVKNGQIDNSPLEPGFSGDARFLSNSAPRTAVGKTSDNKLMIVSASCTIAQLKKLMLNIGCTDALNIDGGGSQGMYYNGKQIKTPGRQLTSVILISVDK